MNKMIMKFAERVMAKWRAIKKMKIIWSVLPMLVLLPSFVFDRFGKILSVTKFY